MTVYSINQRILEQSAATTSATGSGKSDEDAAADFVNALQKAASTLFSGSATASPSAEKALAGHFDRKEEQAAQPKTDTTSSRTETTRSSRQEAREDRAAARAEKKAARDDSRTERAEAKDGAKAAPVEKSEGQVTEDDDTVAVDAVETAPAETVAVEQQVQPEAVAVVVEAPVEQAVQTQVTKAADTVAVEDAAVATADTPAEQLAALPQAAEDDATPEAEAPADAESEGEQPVLTAEDVQSNAPVQAQHAAKAKGKDKVQEQADDLAERLDDTGAQVRVAVKVDNAAKPADTDTAADPAADSLLPHEAAAQAPQPNAGTAGRNPADAQNSGLAATQGNANPGAQGQAASQAATPFEAIMAAQVEATAAKPADASAGQTQGGTQPIAGLTGVTGTTAAQKAQAPQAAQAPRQAQVPQEQQQVMDQISVQIAKQAKNGGDTIKVQLKPTEMGSIEIKLDVAKDGTVTTVVTADNKDTLDMLRRDQSSLQKALNDAGLKSDLGSMSFNLREGNQQQSNQQGAESRVGRRRARLEAAAAADAASATAAAAAQVRWGMSKAGVDIQV